MSKPSGPRFRQLLRGQTKGRGQSAVLDRQIVWVWVKLACRGFSLVIP